MARKILDGYEFVKTKNIDKGIKINFVWRKKGSQKTNEEIPAFLFDFTEIDYKKYFSKKTKIALEKFKKQQYIKLEKFKKQQYIKKEFNTVLTLLKRSKYYDNTMALLTQKSLEKGDMGKEIRAIIESNYKKQLYTSINLINGAIVFNISSKVPLFKKIFKNYTFKFEDYDSNTFNWIEEKQIHEETVAEQPPQKQVDSKKEASSIEETVTEQPPQKQVDAEEEPSSIEPEEQYEYSEIFKDFAEDLESSFSHIDGIEDFTDDDIPLLEEFQIRGEEDAESLLESTPELGDLEVDGETPQDFVYNLEDYINNDDNINQDIEELLTSQITSYFEKLNRNNTTQEREYLEMIAAQIAILGARYGIDLD